MSIELSVSRRRVLQLLTAATGIQVIPTWAAESVPIAVQPYFASVTRAISSLAEAGQPIERSDADRLAALAAQADAGAVAAAETILDRYTLARVKLDAGGVGLAVAGAAERRLIEQGWRQFLVRVENTAALTESLNTSSGDPPARMSSSNAEQRAGLRDTLFNAPEIEKMGVLAQVTTDARLSGAIVEYKVIDVFSRDRGRGKLKIAFGAGAALFGDTYFSRASLALRRQPLSLDFEASPSNLIDLSVLDADGVGCMASLLIKDAKQHVYPPQPMRLAPDMAFHPHIYRADGETVLLPDGEYQVTSWRGPEYVRDTRRLRIGEGSRRIEIRLNRWIDPAKWGWYSGDTHIHAAGCSHYMHPTQGVTPETMIRHVRGEGLSIGDVLTWGPAWYYQKQFFSGHAVSPEATLEHPELQAANNATLRARPTPKDKESLLRYDVEVSQFPSSLSGHLVLLRLKEQDYPGARQIEDWPSWTLPIMRWGKGQGALVGFAHCGLGMGVAATALPNYDLPPFDSIGTNEAIVDITHDACHFLSGCEFEPVSELNAWYHLLNCGFRLAMVGETDYPCIRGERPGVGRSYVNLDKRPVDDAGYNEWVEGIRAGRLYCGDGRSHVLQMSVNDQPLGGKDVQLRRGGTINVSATVAARIEAAPTPETRGIRAGWHLERARVGESRNVPLELIVNGQPVERIEFLADGEPRPVRFKTRIERSSWVALRILPSVHTHPVFISVGGKPIRASRRSAEWLRQCVDVLWKEKNRLMRDSERGAASEAYDHARRTYERIATESDVA